MIGSANSRDKELAVSRDTPREMLSVSCSFGRMLVGCVLGFSAISHLMEPLGFLEAVYSYQVIGRTLGWVVALLLPSIELALAVCLLSGNYLRPALISACFMFAAFVAAQTVVVMRGLSIDCGCFGRLSHPVGVGSILITTFLLVVSFTCAWACRWSGFRRDESPANSRSASRPPQQRPQ